MYCPRCSQEQIKEDVRFCSRCGFSMTGMAEVVENGGLPKEVIDQKHPEAMSPRRRGLKQGGLLFLSGGVIVPILGILTSMFNGEGYIVGMAAILTFLAGILRMIYALVFQSGVPTLENEGIVDTVKKDLLGKPVNNKALPPQQSEPISTEYNPPQVNWRDSDDLQPVSVTEETTRTLDKKTFSQNN